MGFSAQEFRRDVALFAPHPAWSAELPVSARDAAPALRPKIMIVGSAMGALLRSRAAVIKELLAQGFEVVCASAEADVDAEWELTLLGARCVKAPSRWGLLKLLRGERPHLLLACDARPAAMLAAAFAGVRRRAMLVEDLGPAFITTPGKSRSFACLIASAAHRIAGRFAQAVLVANRDDQIFYSEAFMRARHDRVHLAPGLGVELDGLVAEPLPEGTLTFLMIAPLLREKGVYEFAEAARRMKEQQLDVRFVLVGELTQGRGAVRHDELPAWVNDGRLDLGEVADAHAWMKASHVLVLPSYREGLPQVVMTAMAMGRPCIVSDVPGCRDLVTHHKDGIVIAPQSAGALAEAATLVVRIPALLGPWARAAAQTARAKFDAVHHAADLVRRLQAL